MFRFSLFTYFAFWPFLNLVCSILLTFLCDLLHLWLDLKLFFTRFFLIWNTYIIINNFDWFTVNFGQFLIDFDLLVLYCPILFYFHSLLIHLICLTIENVIFICLCFWLIGYHFSSNLYWLFLKLYSHLGIHVSLLTILTSLPPPVVYNFYTFLAHFHNFVLGYTIFDPFYVSNHLMSDFLYVHVFYQFFAIFYQTWVISGLILAIFETMSSF